MIPAVVIGMIIGIAIGYRFGAWHSLTMLGKAERSKRMAQIRTARRMKE